MTDLEYEPNSIESLIRKYLGGIRKPTETQAGNVARVIASANEINLEYVPQSECTGQETRIVYANTLDDIGIGSSWVDVGLILTPAGVTNAVMCRMHYRVKLISSPSNLYTEGTKVFYTLGNTLYLAATHNEISDGRIRVTLNPTNTGVVFQILQDAIYGGVAKVRVEYMLV
jgi:hypothetical protein